MVGRIVFRCLMLTVVVEDLPVLSVLVLGLPTPSRLRKRPNRSKWTKGSEKEKRTVRKGLKNLRKRCEPLERDERSLRSDPFERDKRI